MTTAQEIISQVQSMIGDIGYNKIQPAEYVDMLDEVLYDVSRVVRIWVYQYEYIGPTVAYVATAALLPVNPPDRSVFIIEDSQTAVWWDALQTQSYRTYLPHLIHIRPQDVRISKILQVMRRGERCNQVSIQSIETAVSNGHPFEQNRIDATPFMFHAMRLPDEGTYVWFAKDILPNERIDVEYYLEKPFAIRTQRETTPIPDMVHGVAKYGLAKSVAERLYIAGDDKMGARVQLLDATYKKEIAALNAYTRNYLDESTPIQAQPRIWLQE